MANAAAAVAQAATCSSSQTLLLSPSPFDGAADSSKTISVLPTRSSDPARLLLSLAAKSATAPAVLLAPSDPVAISRIVPHLSQLARSPVVLNIATTSDHSPVTGLLRAPGLALLFSGSAEEAQVNALVALRYATETRRGIVHWFEVEEQSTTKLWYKTQLTAAKKYVEGKSKSSKMNGQANGHTENTEDSATSDSAEVDAETVLESAFNSLPKSIGRAQPANYTGPPSPSSLIIAVGSAASLQEVQLRLPPSAGLLSLNLIAPFTPSRLAKLVHSSVSQVLVLEQSHARATRLGGPVLLLVSALLAENESNASVVGRTLGKIGTVNAEAVASALKESLAEDAPVQGQSVGDVVPVAGHSAQLHVPRHEAAYTRILDTLFGPRLHIANAVDPSADSSESTIPSSLPELALGKILATQQSSNDKSTWIIGSDAWAYDLGTSGVHHALSSGANVNLLLIDSQPYPGPDAVLDPEVRAKKDVGLYAMNYGNAYVASVAVYGDYSQVVRAFSEADKFNGPSIVLAYLPGGDQDSAKALDVLKETKRAVDSGYWPLYRWNPSRNVHSVPGEKKSGSSWDPSNDQDAFQLDSERIKADLRAFLDRSNHLTMLARNEPIIADSVVGSYGKQIKDATDARAKAAFEKLSGAVDGPSVLVLYASDGGNAEKVAKRFAMRARLRKLGARVIVMDDFTVDDLAMEPHVILLTSTAGQGEFPNNGRKFWKALQKISTSLGPAGGDGKNLDKVQFSVFAMGDSHYWPRPEDAHYYNKSGKDLDKKMSGLGAQRFVDLGLGDDQDADGYLTGYKVWEQAIWKALGVGEIEISEAEPEPITNEHIKIASNYLRGTIMQGLDDKSTGALAESDGQLTKFHGIYQQDDRDIRDQRKEEGLEPAYSFMVRVRVPAGVCTPAQWLQINDISDSRGNHTFKMTTRQAFQFHGIVKGNLKPAIQEINKASLDTVAACGDVNRNVMCTANPSISKLHAQVHQFSIHLSEHLMPQTPAYAEIWLDKKMVAGDALKTFVEPLYGKYYLPRKFKIAIAVPPHNDTDVFCHDIGFIAILDKSTKELAGYNVSIGGGMGVTHAMKTTYPRLGDVVGFVTADKAVDVAEKIMLVQRDNGNRANRKNARLKYTIDRMGLSTFVDEVEKRLGYSFEPAREYTFKSNTDEFGWFTGEDGKHNCTIFIENGRVEDSPDKPQKTGLAEVAKIHKGVFRMTANQHVVIAGVATEDKPAIEKLLAKYKLDKFNHSGLRLSSSACVAFPTCGLAMAESERFLPGLIDRIENILEEVGLRHDSIVMRVTGCPNGCARPYAAEVAFVGKAANSYLFLLGGGYYGQRLNKIYREAVSEDEIVEIMTPMLKSYAKNRLDGERFGDFAIRQNWVAPTTEGRLWYDKMAEPGKAVLEEAE